MIGKTLMDRPGDGAWSTQLLASACSLNFGRRGASWGEEVGLNEVTVKPSFVIIPLDIVGARVSGARRFSLE